MATGWFEPRTDERAPAPSIEDDEIQAARWFSEPPDGMVDFRQSRIETWAGTRD